MASNYGPSVIEPKWQKKWEAEGLYKTSKAPKKKKYILDMYPYPSGASMHVGHVEGYVGTDILSRYHRMNGFDVLHPMGWDSFGLPAENYAIQTGIHPAESTAKNIKTFKRQLESAGLSYDWDREVNSSDPNYYKWNQWLFIQLFKKGLAYKAAVDVNWCPSCETVLANEQVVEGRCERCEAVVTKKKLDQWFLKITAYADRLIDGLTEIDWLEEVKVQQKNWIGKAKGTRVVFKIKDSDKELAVFTTRADTLFGSTFMVLAPEHPLVEELREKITNYSEAEEYRKQMGSKPDFERSGAKEKTGVELRGVKAINPLNGQELPIYVSDFVLMTYGTGAIMAVPAHDQRDFEFARKFDLPVISVVAKPENTGVVSVEIFDGDVSELALDIQKLAVAREQISPVSKRYEIDRSSIKKMAEVLKQHQITTKDLSRIEKGEDFTLDLKGKIQFSLVYMGDGEHINSDFLNGLDNAQAIVCVNLWLVKEGLGAEESVYHIRDWLISRQRYWGTPIPMIFCEKCSWQPVPVSDLPVLLPKDVDFKPTGDSPIARSEEFQKRVVCPECGEPARREVDTMDGYVDSSWYFIRFADPNNKDEFASAEAMKKWLPVDVYVGGGHVVQHLLFARFFWKVLFDEGLIEKSLGDEPFLRLRAPGWILGPDSRKMSKRWNNVITPDDIIPKYGADTLRMYEMFMGPFEAMKPWSLTGVEGMNRFIRRVWKMLQEHKDADFKIEHGPRMAALTHKTIKRVTEDIPNLKFNTAIAGIMEYVNGLQDMIAEWTPDNSEFVKIPEWDEAKRTLLLLLAPLAPHVTEELWERLGKEYSIHQQGWPEVDPEFLQDDEVEIPVQVNGKLRGTVKTKNENSKNKNEIEKLAKEEQSVAKYIERKQIKRVIFVPGKLLNFVT